jgi:two-component system, OmpR family, response regulator MprA
MKAPTVLLIGAGAEALAPRLELSGYRWRSAAMDRVDPDGDPCGEPSCSPAAVILSPGCEGWIPELRRRWGPVPVLIGIEADDMAGRSHCLASGADDFWLTTLGPSDLLTRLRLHLGLARSAPTSMPSLQVGDLEVNPQTRQVRRGRRLVNLSAREYQLLLLLLRHRGEVLGRERILREIWNDQPAASSNVIEVYVRYLRQKLEEGGERRLIHTVRGRGYSLGEHPPQWKVPQP